MANYSNMGPQTDFSGFFKGIGKGVERWGENRRNKNMWEALINAPKEAEKAATQQIRKQGSLTDAEYNRMVEDFINLDDIYKQGGQLTPEEQKQYAYYNQVGMTRDKIGERSIGQNLMGIVAGDKDVGRLGSLKSLVGLGEEPDTAVMTNAELVNYFQKLKDLENYQQTGQMTPDMEKRYADILQQEKKARIIPALGKISPEAALRESGYRVDKASSTAADLARTPEAQEAYARFSKAKTAVITSKQNNNAQGVADGYNAMTEAASDYFNATGKQLPMLSYSAITNATTNELKAQMGAIKIEQEGIKTKQLGSEEKSKAVQLINSGVEKFVNYKKDFVKGLQQISHARSLASQLAGNDSPAAMFAAVKLLSQQIEPGLSVTEGEVRGYSGDNSVTEALKTMRRLISLIPGVGNKDIAELEQDAAKANPMTLQQIKQLMTSLGNSAEASYRSAIDAGTTGIANDIAGDIQDIYAGTIDQSTLDNIKSRIATKLESYLGGFTKIAPSKTTPTVPKEQPQAQPTPSAQPTAEGELTQQQQYDKLIADGFGDYTTEAELRNVMTNNYNLTDSKLTAKALDLFRKEKKLGKYKGGGKGKGTPSPAPTPTAPKRASSKGRSA